MGVFFVDISALGKRYVAETGSAWLHGVLTPATGGQTIIVRTTTVELISALTRREWSGSLTAADAAAARSEFRSHLRDEYLVMEVSEALADRAMLLAETHGLRGYDAIQLAAALEANSLRTASGRSPITLISSDLELNAAAVVEGLTVDDPNAHR